MKKEQRRNREITDLKGLVERFDIPKFVFDLTDLRLKNKASTDQKKPALIPCCK
ncbi:hypothetical protein HanXRQr2_Chr14g0656811 [Helianthus annuus]|uniref:Uncharacterized protein n=1 Tax=Helianthus annuus TaxID=4232 RepID=A0A9K3EC88_HELAN|nr:hypothetical protein HanXRQr2_Chr14g0656811 [Helianthus annuus]KAJ0841384.1 hypothetical protein HanPSC8_Chr14g0629791 [Helianthus annuus]